jgi:hypothetical protein
LPWTLLWSHPEHKDPMAAVLVYLLSLLCHTPSPTRLGRSRRPGAERI